MISIEHRPTQQWRREGPRASSSTPPQGPSFRNMEKGKIEMKALVLMAAVLTSAILTVPTVTQVADVKIADLRLDA